MVRGRVTQTGPQTSNAAIEVTVHSCNSPCCLVFVYQTYATPYYCHTTIISIHTTIHAIHTIPPNPTTSHPQTTIPMHHQPSSQPSHHPLTPLIQPRQPALTKVTPHSHRTPPRTKKGNTGEAGQASEHRPQEPLTHPPPKQKKSVPSAGTG